MSAILVVVATLAVAITIGLTIMTRLLVVCGPRELLVIAGRGSPHERAYSVLRGGRMVRIPGFQRVFRLPLGAFEVPFVVRARDRRHVPIVLAGCATLRIGDDDRAVDRAARLLLGLDQATLTKMAERVVGSSVGGVVAHLDALQLIEEPRLSQQEMIAEIEARAADLGLMVDGLRIDDIRDDSGYLEARQAARRARR